MPLRRSSVLACVCLCSCVGTADLVLGSHAPVSVAPDAGAGLDAGEVADAGTADAGGAEVDAGPSPVIDAGFDAGPPLPCGTLDSRLTTATVSVSPASVDVGSSYGWSNNRPVHFAGLTDGTARIAWSGSGMVHVTPVSATSARLGPDVTLPGESVRGFVAHDDGTLALLVVRGTGMFIVKVRADGSVLFETPIVNDTPEVEGSRWVDSWGHEGRLVFTGQVYVAYFGHTKHFGSIGKHQGDLLISLSATTGLPTAGPAGWDWGCSHSLDVRLAWDGASIAPVCLSDCYRAKAVMWGDSDVLQDEPSGNCGGSSNGQLGGLASLAAGGFGFTFATQEGRASRDVGFIAFDAQLRKSAVVWLTSAAGDETVSHLARYGTGQFLVSWKEGADDKLAVLSAAGAFVEGPISAAVGLADRDDFAQLPGGDVGWAEGAGSGLRISRVRSCTP
jgi:hypothetical protein